jgi:nucleoid-associated protein YgaU
MERLDELKQKYKAALDIIQSEGVHLTHLHVQDNKLFIQGAAPSEDVKNNVWNQIKAADPSYSDLTADLTVDSSLPQAQRPQAAAAAASGSSGKTYKVQPGDTLSKISQQFYGKASEYNRIFEANRDKLSDPNKVQVGQELVIPS